MNDRDIEQQLHRVTTSTRAMMNDLELDLAQQIRRADRRARWHFVVAVLVFIIGLLLAVIR